MLTGSFSLRDIVDAQSGTFWWIIPRWNIFYGGQFIAFFIYLMSAYAETKPHPIRFAGGGDRTGGWLPHRIQRH